jgi:MSHA pilin protein MshD
MTHLAAHQRGLTLIELVTSITIIGLAGIALLGVLAYLSANSGTALEQARAQAAADLYLAEALAKPFLDPDGIDGEPLRAQFDDVDDYNGLDDSAALDRTGTLIAPLRVRVAVVPTALTGAPAANMRRVDVLVDLSDGQQLIASGYRARYP